MLVGVVVSFMIMIMMLVTFVFVRPLGRFRLGGIFESVNRTQLFAFQALWAPNQMLGAYTAARR
jgi:hypothetical protein